MKIAVYAGSFNPYHLGHDDITRKALTIFDKLIILQCINPKKEIPDSSEMNSLRRYYLGEYGTFNKETTRVDATVWGCALVHFEENWNKNEKYPITAFIRGLRNGEDLAYETNQQRWNEAVGLKATFVNFITAKEFSHVSSSAIREVESLGLEHSYRLNLEEFR